MAKRATKKRPPSATASGQTRLIIEAFERKLDTVIELLNEKPNRSEMNERFHAIELRLDTLEAVVRDHSARLLRIEEELVRINGELVRINGELVRINGELVRLDTEVRAIRADFEAERKARRVDTDALAALERRVTVIEAQLGIAPP